VYVAYFNLRELPFSIAPDPAYLYMSARHQEALGHLLYGTGQYGGFVQLTGEVGTGKTTIVRTLLSQKLENVDVAMIHNPRQSEAEFVESICDELGAKYPRNPAPTLKQLVDALNAYLLKTHADGRRTVLIIDEAQNLSPQVLEQVRLLTNLETDKEKLLRIMLVGQPELAELLARPDLRQLASRITARYHLLPLREPETSEYINHRLRVAGGSTELFTPAAVHTIHRRSGGVPRLVNIICDRALLGAYAQDARQVTPAIVEHAAAEALGSAVPVSWHERLRRRLPRVPLMWIEGTLACAGLIVAGILLQSAFGGHSTAQTPRPQTPPVERQSSAASAMPADRHEDPQAMPASTTSSTPDATTQGIDTAPSKLAMAGLGSLLQQPEPIGNLMGRLIALWDPQLQIPPGANVCSALEKNQIECLHGNGHWTDLDQMNRPAILTLSLGRNNTQYVLLRRLGDNTAVLDTPDGLLKVPLTQLGAAWNGEFLLLWKNDAGSTQINLSSRGAAVVWLRRKLAAVGGQAIPSAPSPVFDSELRRQVMTYQRAADLQVDGVAGTQTLMSLTAIGHEKNTPMLHPPY